MRKTDKKFDNDLRKSLTQLCENELEQLEGFQWLTHTVNYPNIQSTLKIVCVFDSNINLEQFLASNQKAQVESRILKILSSHGVSLKKATKQLLFDTEENCNRINHGNWAERLA